MRHAPPLITSAWVLRFSRSKAKAKSKFKSESESEFDPTIYRTALTLTGPDHFSHLKSHTSHTTHTVQPSCSIPFSSLPFPSLSPAILLLEYLMYSPICSIFTPSSCCLLTLVSHSSVSDQVRIEDPWVPQPIVYSIYPTSPPTTDRYYSYTTPYRLQDPT